jgi:pimeloyl-ACP methyl ester carboxylesterase
LLQEHAGGYATPQLLRHSSSNEQMYRTSAIFSGGPAAAARTSTSYAASANTGLLQDTQTLILVAIRACSAYLSRFWGGATTNSSNSDHHRGTGTGHAAAVDSLSSLDMRTVPDLVREAGYPFQEISFATSDSVVLPLHRLPRPAARRVVLFQHGIFDSAFAWVAPGAARGLAYRAFDLGFDVFLGNFRGNPLTKEHNRPGYWDFCVDEHGQADLAGMVDALVDTKRGEGIDPDNLHITLVAHSMGGAAAMIYVATRANHRIDRLVLLAPAGFQGTAPFICRLLGPVISAALRVYDFGVIRIWPPVLRLALTKLLEDIRQSSLARSLFVSLVATVLGGPVQEHPFGAIHNLAFMMFQAATSTKCFKQFWQWHRSGLFTSWEGDINYAESYGNIGDGVDVHLIAGAQDKLIPPSMVVEHYNALVRARRGKTSRAHFAVLENMGHVELTLAMTQEAYSSILSRITGEGTEPCDFAL